MRNFIAFLCGISCGLGSFDPCWSVGFLLLKIPSFCEDNSFCSFIATNSATGQLSLLWGPRGTTEMLSCEQAEVFVSGIANRHPITLSDPIETIVTEILSAVRQLLYNSNPLGPAVIGRFVELYREVPNILASRNDFPALSVARSKFLSGPVITELNTYARVAASRLSLSSDVLPPHYEDTAQFLHLYFDLMSVYSPIFVSMRLDEFGFARCLSRAVRPLYRSRHPSEIVARELSRELPTDAAAIIPLARYIMQLTRRVPRTYGEKHFTVKSAASFLIGCFIQGTHAQPSTSAVQAMLANQVEQEVCPFADYFLMSLGTDSIEHVFKLANLLVKLCHSQLTTRRLLELGHLLARVTRGNRVTRIGKPDEHVELLVLALENHELPWHFGLHEELSNATVVQTVLDTYVRLTSPLLSAGNGFQVFKPRSMFMFRGPFEKSLQAIGRAIGLCVLHQCSLRSLRLPRLMASAIRGQPVTSESEARQFLDPFLVDGKTLETVIADYILEPASYIAFGVRDVLGPFGTIVLSEAHWEALF
jgi:hypothetical protein